MKKQRNSVDCFCQIIKLFDISLIENRCGNMHFLLFLKLSFPGVLLTYANLKFEVESFSIFFFSRCVVFNIQGNLVARKTEL